MHGRGNSYPPHVRRINDAFPGLRPLRFRRLPLVRQRQQYDCCQLIFKLPVLWRSGAAARLSSLHTPVETGAAPYWGFFGYCSNTRGKSVQPHEGFSHCATLGNSVVREGLARCATLGNSTAHKVFARCAHNPWEYLHMCGGGGPSPAQKTYLPKGSASFSGSGYVTPWVSTVTFAMTWSFLGLLVIMLRG